MYIYIYIYIHIHMRGSGLLRPAAEGRGGPPGPVRPGRKSGPSGSPARAEVRIYGPEVGLGSESASKMIEKVDVGNEKMYISIISVRQMEAYVKSWVSVILGVRWARKQLLVPGDTTPCVDSTQSLCGLHTQTGAGGAGRGGAEVRGKSGGTGLYSSPPQAAIPCCGRITTRRHLLRPS